MRSDALALAVLVALGAGCSSAHDSGADAHAFLAALDRALCDRVTSCAGAYDPLPGRRYFHVLPVCHPAGRYPLFVGAADAVAAGQLGFDAAAAAQCLADLASLPCRGPHALGEISTARCSDVFAERVPLGGQCDSALWIDPCAGSAYCGASDACGGRCVAPAADGQSCNARPCEHGGCGVVPGSLDTFCGPVPAEGEPCTNVCAHPDACMSGVCVPRPMVGEGEVCGDTLGLCTAPLACDASMHGPNGVCRQPYSLHAGDACSTPLFCATDAPFCVDGHCQPSGHALAGDACASDIDCDATAGWCVGGVCTAEEPVSCDAAAPVDLFAVTRDQCPDGQRCAYSEGHCLPVSSLHGACSRATSCPDGARCVAGACEPVVHEGAPCASDVLCPDGFACTGGVCTALPVVGEACVDRCLDADCTAGRCALRPDGASCADEDGVYLYRPGLRRTHCQGWCGAASTCVAIGAVGEPCGVEPNCRRGLRCFASVDRDGVCEAETCGP